MNGNCAGNEGPGAGRRQKMIEKFHRKGIFYFSAMFLGLHVIEAFAKFVLSKAIPRHEISAIYLGGLCLLLTLFLVASWCYPIANYLMHKEFKKTLFRILALLPMMVIAKIGFFLVVIVLPNDLSGWPLDSVYSTRREKYYFLTYEFSPTDTVYKISSATRTWLNPLWAEECGRPPLDYSEDGSLTSNPHLILSKDESLLVVARGGQYTDAINLDTGQAITEPVAWDDGQREQLWRMRTEKIIRALQHHGGIRRSDTDGNARGGEAIR